MFASVSKIVYLGPILDLSHTSFGFVLKPVVSWETQEQINFSTAYCNDERPASITERKIKSTYIRTTLSLLLGMTFRKYFNWTDRVVLLLFIQTSTSRRLYQLSQAFSNKRGENRKRHEDRLLRSATSWAFLSRHYC